MIFKTVQADFLHTGPNNNLLFSQPYHMCHVARFCVNTGQEALMSFGKPQIITDTLYLLCKVTY